MEAISRHMKVRIRPTPPPSPVSPFQINRYTTRRGSLQYRENIGIISEGSGTSRASPQGKGKAPGGRGAQGKLWGGRGGGGGRFGRPKASSAGAMSHILFRGSKGGVEGRLPREVRPFLGVGGVAIGRRAVGRRRDVIRLRDSMRLLYNW